MDKITIVENRWMSYYLLLRKYFEMYGNIDISDSYKINDIMLGSWLSRQKQAYKNSKITKDKIRLLNALNIDWSPKDTKFLNDKITVDHHEKYNEVLLSRFNRILEDMIYEEINEIWDNSTQQEMEEVIIKRLWR